MKLILVNIGHHWINRAQMFAIQNYALDRRTLNKTTNKVDFIRKVVVPNWESSELISM